VSGDDAVNHDDDDSGDDDVPPVSDDDDGAGKDDDSAIDDDSDPPPVVRSCGTAIDCVGATSSGTNQEAKFCDPISAICVACITSANCVRGEYCDPSVRECVKESELDHPPVYACTTTQDCYDNQNAMLAGLDRCEPMSEKCVDCLDDSNCPQLWSMSGAKCDPATYRCYDTTPRCDPPCDESAGDFCVKGNVCHHFDPPPPKGAYCDYCMTDSDCIDGDAFCYRPAGFPSELEGRCARKCIDYNQCSGFEPAGATAGACFEFACLCPMGWTPPPGMYP
jgi:hypothetical protein